MKGDSGFTLLEGLMAMTILSVLVALSLPRYTSLVEDQQGRLILQSIADSVALGRTTAIKTGIPVTLCPSPDGLACQGGWLAGHLLFTDLDLDRELDSGDQLLRYAVHPEGRGSLTWRAFQNRQYLQITAQGFLRRQNGSFTWCSSSGSAAGAYQLIVNGSGRMRFAVDADGDGQREDSQGRPLPC